MGDTKKAAADNVAGQYLKDLDPTFLDQWRKDYGGGQRVVSAPDTYIQSGTDDAGQDPLAAGLRAANKTPGPSQQPKSLFDMKTTPAPESTSPADDMTDAQRLAATRQPRGGDWKDAQNYAASVETGKRTQNLAGATFAEPTGSAAPVMVSPGGRTPHSWSTQTQEGVKLSPETKEAAETAEGNKMDAARWGMRATEQDADRELSILRHHELVQQARETELRDRATRQRQQYEESLTKLNDMTDAVRGDRVESDAYFKNASLGGKFAIGLSRLLIGGFGGLGAGMQGRGAPNQGLQAINDSIRDEFDEQKENARLRRSKLEDQRSLLGQMAKTFGDERTAEDAAWILYLERAKTQLASGAAEAKSDYAKSKYKDALAQISGEIASRREKWDQLEQDRVTRVQHDVNAPPTYAGGGPTLQKRDREEATEMAKELVTKGIPQSRAQLENIDRTIDSLGSGDVPGIGQFAGMVPDKLVGHVFGDRAVAARQAVQVIKNAIGHAQFGGALSPTEAEKLNKQLEGAGDAASLRRVVQQFRAELAATESTIRSMGSDAASAEVARRQGANKKLAVPVDRPAAPYIKPPE